MTLPPAIPGLIECAPDTRRACPPSPRCVVIDNATTFVQRKRPFCPFAFGIRGTARSDYTRRRRRRRRISTRIIKTARTFAFNAHSRRRTHAHIMNNIHTPTDRGARDGVKTTPHPRSSEQSDGALRKRHKTAQLIAHNQHATRSHVREHVCDTALDDIK